MVFSNQEILKQKNLTDFNNITPDVVDMLRRERLNPLRIIDEAEKFVDDKYYDKESFKAKYGFDKRDYDVLISIKLHSLVFGNKKYRDRIIDLFIEQLDKHGAKLLNELDKVIPGSDLVSDPDISLIEAKYMLMTKNGDKNAVLKEYLDMEFDMAKEAAARAAQLGDARGKAILQKFANVSELH